MLLFALSACLKHIPEPPAAVPVSPSTDARVSSACWIEFATGTMPHGIAVAHGAVEQDVDSTQSGLLVTGPGGTWLIDGGMALDVPHQIDGVGGLLGYFLRRATKGWVRIATPVEGVQAAGVTPLVGLLPTHAHWDHLGGLLDLPDLPIWLPGEELAVAQASVDGRATAVTPNDARALLPRAKTLTFEQGPLWLWEKSHDLMGDGSVQVVPMPGHSPGSVGVRVALPDGRQVFLVGDTVWLREGFEQREHKGWPAAGIVDEDKEATADQVARIWALHQAEPEVLILPAHDRRSWLEVFGAPGCVTASAPPPM